MYKKNYYIQALGLILLAFITSFAACSSKKHVVVAEIGSDKITLDDFERQFLKTVNSVDSAKNTTMKERKDFLDLLIKFRLKVKDGRERGLLQSEDIQKDLNEYKKNFVSTFLIDKKVVEPSIKDLYDKKKYEVRASHILVNLSQTPTPEDSIKAYEKAKQVIERLKNGDNFEQVAKEMSDDPTAQQNGGDLYYFTGGMTVPEFEDAIFKMKVGEYSKQPIRTMFGLHIVKLTDKKERNDGIRASHILIQDQKDSAGRTIDSIGTLNKAKTILERIKKGEDFATVASEVSDDPGSKSKGGDLGVFDRRRMVQPFDSAAFSLKEGQVSDLVRTPFGWHIIKVTEIKKYDSFDNQKEKLKSEFKRSAQYKAAYNTYLEKLRKDYDFKIKPEGISLLAQKFDSTKLVSAQNLDSSLAGMDGTVVASYDGGEVKVSNIREYLNMNKDNAGSPGTFATIQNIINGAAEIPLLAAAAQKEKVEKDPAYVDLITEYENGLLSFKIDQEELWSKIKLTDNDLRTYYDANKAKYTYTENNESKTRSFDEVKSEISNTLQQEKFKTMESAYVEELKKKYPVKIHDEALEKAFKE